MNIERASARPCGMGAGAWRGVATVLLFVLAFPVRAQQGRVFDIAHEPVTEFGRSLDSRRIAIHGVTLGMSWGEARNILDRANIAYIFQKGTAPVVYIPPQNSSFYFVLNPSSYDVIEMGIIGPSELPVDNQYLFDAQRWRLTTARVQFFGSEGEFIVNEEGESYNFPYQGFVLKYLTPGTFRFVMVQPTNKPLLAPGQGRKPSDDQEIKQPLPPKPPERDEGDALRLWHEKFAQARSRFEAREYHQALEGFRDVMSHAPDALLKVRARYWMGEAYFQLRHYREALKQFETVMRETDIETLRSPAAYMAARCRKALGRR
ncbi:MAG: hypothetical protein QHI48_09625 [Bacteroidota bacterium]|nr:hypothetical protein [Bacteroidota bacterium]